MDRKLATVSVSGTVESLSSRFLDSNQDARGWKFLFPDESDWESPDCDVMSEQFLAFAQAEGFVGHLVRVDSVDEGQHWFTVVTVAGETIAFDWTARQFYNAGYPAPSTDPALIPCPLVFVWPGSYPLDVVDFSG